MFQSRNQPLKRRAGRPRERRAEGRPAEGALEEGAGHRKGCETGDSVPRCSSLLHKPTQNLRAVRQPALTVDTKKQGAAGRAAGANGPKLVFLHRPGAKAAGPASCEPGGAQDQQGIMSMTSATRQGNGEVRAEENKHRPET